MLENAPAASPRAYVQLADVYRRRHQTNAAVDVLLRAKALAFTLDDASGLESEIEEQAKKISPKVKLKLAVTPETCRALGFLEITNAAQTFERECDLGQPLLLFTTGKRGCKTIALTVRPPQKGAYPWTLAQAEDGMRSTSSSSFDLTGAGEWRQTFTVGEAPLKVTALPLSGQRRIKFTLQTGD